MADVTTSRIESFDGVELAVHEIGEGRPLVLLHGFFSDANTNWVRYGHAAKIADMGYHVIMPDLRGHGESGKPHDPQAYQPDTLARDGLAVVGHFGLSDYHLGGYSLGARTVVRMHVLGARPKRLIVAGMGLSGLVDLSSRTDHFRHILTNLGEHERGTPEWMAEAFLKTTGGDAEALLLVLNVFTDTPEADLRAIAMPVLVLAGEEDEDNGNHADLAAMLPDATHREVPGGHMSCIVKPEFGEALVDWLGEPGAL